MNDVNLIGTKLGNYRLERLLGRGRMGVVYLARDEALLRPTAVKILSWSLPEQHGLNPEDWFLAEARNVARINHPHVIQIYGVAKHAQHCYIAMEYVAGAAADAWVSETGPFSPLRATEILLQAANALQAAHDADVVHRDVKPGNLLITADGTAKLGDFGMALTVTGDARFEATRAGTPYYTAPEIWRGQSATRSTDIYALGATYFHLLTGRPPHESANLEQLIAAHLEADVPDARKLVPSLPLECCRLIERCMQKSPKERYASAQELSWEARGVIREINTIAPLAARPSPVLVKTASSEGWVEFFEFGVRPFSGVDPERLPCTRGPFPVVREELTRALHEPDVHSVLLSGELGSGKTTLVQHVIANWEPAGSVAYLSRDEPGSSLLQQISRAFGIGPASSPSNSAIDHLITQLERAHPPPAPPALLVLDNITPSSFRIGELETLMQAGSKTRGFRTLVVGTPEFEEQWTARKASEELHLRRLSMPALTAMETLQYIGDWLRFALSPRVGGVLITPDAALIVAHRSGGNLGRINVLVRRMLESAAAQRRRLLTSWDAWNVSVEGGGPRSSEPNRPLRWPTSEVLEILNSQRGAVGIPGRRTDPRGHAARELVDSESEIQTAKKVLLASSTIDVGKHEH